ncbi:MAG: DMT family transporter [Planctomycetota bacterium]
MTASISERSATAPVSPAIGCRAAAVMAAAGVALGFSTNLAKLADQWGLPGDWFLVASAGGATALLGLYALTRGERVGLSPRRLEYYAIAGLVGVALPNYLGFLAAPRIGAGFVALSFAFPPLLTYLGALALGMQRFRWRAMTGALLSLAGVAILAAGKLAEPDADRAWIAATMAIPLSLAVGNLYRTIRWPAGATPEELAPGTLAAATAMAGVAALAGAAPGDWPPAATLTPPVAGLCVAQSVAFAAFFGLFFVLQKIGGPMATSLVGSIGAAAGTLLAVAMLGESPPAGLLPASALILIGIWLVVRE